MGLPNMFLHFSIETSGFGDLPFYDPPLITIFGFQNFRAAGHSPCHFSGQSHQPFGPWHCTAFSDSGAIHSEATRKV